MFVFRTELFYSVFNHYFSVHFVWVVHRIIIGNFSLLCVFVCDTLCRLGHVPSFAICAVQRIIYSMYSELCTMLKLFCICNRWLEHISKWREKRQKKKKKRPTAQNQMSDEVHSCIHADFKLIRIYWICISVYRTLSGVIQWFEQNVIVPMGFINWFKQKLTLHLRKLIFRSSFSSQNEIPADTLLNECVIRFFKNSSLQIMWIYIEFYARWIFVSENVDANWHFAKNEEKNPELRLRTSVDYCFLPLHCRLVIDFNAR